MLFTAVKEIEAPDGAAGALPGVLHELRKSAGGRQRVATIKPWAVVWATVLIAFFVVVSIYTHQTHYEAMATVSLNLAVAVTSASVGAVMGERMAVKELGP